MAEWVKWMKGFAKKPEVLRVAASLGVSRYHAASLIMEKVFEWTDENISAENLDKDGNATVTLGPLPLQLFDAQTEVPGLANAMSAAGWIIARSDSLVFPNFARHNGNSAKTRALTSKRVAKHRDETCNADVTLVALPEEKREEDRKKKKEAVAVAVRIEWSPEGGWTGITPADRDGWAVAYPACDITRQLAAMSEWLMSNPTKAQKRKWRAFVTNWLQRSQERGGDALRLTGHPSGQNAPQPYPRAKRDTLAEYRELKSREARNDAV